MDILLTILAFIVVGFITLFVVLFLLRLLMPIIFWIGTGYAIYLFFFLHQKLYAVILFALLVMFAAFFADDEEAQTAKEHTHKVEHKKRAASYSNSSMNKAMMYLIPIFWPYLILKAIFSGKQVKTDMSPYDYEQHLKSNGK